MENNAFITVAHPVGSLCLCCSLGVSKFLPMYDLFRNMKVHNLVTRNEVLGETEDNPWLRALKWATGEADLGLA